MMDLSLLWIGIIAFAVLMYVVLDGFDLGIGILFPFFPEQAERDVMMNTVAPIWDGNETWMVLGGASLFAAFPLAYATVLSALYLPVILMVIALIFRGVAFEFRFKANSSKHWWDKAFIGGSVFSSFLQGVILGAYIQGIRTEQGVYAGHGWLIFKTDQALQQRMYRLMPKMLIGLLIVLAAVSIYTPITQPHIAERWFSLPQLLYFSPVPILVLIFTYLALKACRQQQQFQPFLYTLALVFLAYSGFLISLWPYIIPPSVSFWQAAAPESSQRFTLIGALVLIPIILGYSAMSYWIFAIKSGWGMMAIIKENRHEAHQGQLFP